MSVPYDDVVRMIRTFAATIAENKEYLTELDSAIGDADHGINMDRGFQAVLVKLDALPPGDVGSLFKAVGMTLVSTVGGAGGPLYGTLFLQLGTATAGKAEIDAQDWAAALAAAVQGVQARGKAELQDKTMVDALAPARDAFTEALERRSVVRRRAPALGGRRRRRHEGHDPARGPQGQGELPGRAERRTPRPRRHVVVPVAEDGRGDVERGRAHDRTVNHGRDTATDAWKEAPHGGLRRCPRPGHHEHAVHDLRPQRQRGRGGPEGARADLPEAGLGRARPEGDLGRARRR